MLTPLNLPPAPLRLQRKDNVLYVLDILRKKMLQLTPEEWVRQHFIHFLLANHYPQGLISIERGHQVNELQKRTDIVVYQSNGKPFLVIECKAAEVQLSPQHFQQLANYNHALQAPFIALSNGLTHYYWQQSPEGYSNLTELPIWKY
jgi:type I site-specific restriction endonuclease